MFSVKEHALKEFLLVKNNNKLIDYIPIDNLNKPREYIIKDSLEILDLLEKQNNNEISSKIILKTLLILLDNKPLTTLYGDDAEWIMLDTIPNILQNIRHKNVYKYPNGKSYIHNLNYLCLENNKLSTIMASEITFPYSLPKEPILVTKEELDLKIKESDLLLKEQKEVILHN